MSGYRLRILDFPRESDGPTPAELDALETLRGAADALHEAAKDFRLHNPNAAKPNLYDRHEARVRALIAKAKGRPA